MSGFRCRLGLLALLALLPPPSRAGWRAVEAELRFRPQQATLAAAGAPLEFRLVAGEDEQGMIFRPDRWELARPANGLLPPGSADFAASFTLSNRLFRAVSWVTAADGRTATWTFRAAGGAAHTFTFAHPHTHFDPATGIYRAPDMDVLNTSLLSAVHGAGMLAGSADLTVWFQPDGLTAEAANDCLPDFGPSDLWLNDLTAPVQGARVAGDRVAIAPAARLANIGSADVRWEWAIAPPGGNGPLIGPHPYLVMHYYRIRDGRIEQIGRSDVKHAWNSTNEGCGCFSGQVMYQGCSDVYSAANNLNQFYFGPRAEVSAFTGAWSSLGSHFDGLPVDNVRNHGFLPGDHTAFDHRLVVAEADLAAPAQSQWVEAWYLSAQDTNVTNNIAHRRVTPALVSGIWQFSASGVTTNGPAIGAWVPRGAFTASLRHEVADTGEGRVHAAVRVTRQGSGRYRYDYAVHNFDFDRGVSALRVPARAAAGTSERLVLDGDTLPGNDWTNRVEEAAVIWSGPVQPLTWGTLRSFSLESSEPPAAGNVFLSVASPSFPGQEIAVPSLVPTGLHLVRFTRLGPTVSFASLPGATYRVQRADRPDATVWVDAAPLVVATGVETSVPVDPGPDAGAIFRVRWESP